MTILSPDQSRAFETIERWARSPDSDLLTFGGYAGTGKTTLVSELAKELKTKRIAFCAPTGRAAAILAKKLEAAGVDITERNLCSTVHSLTAIPVEDLETGEVNAWKQKSTIGEYDLIVVDEASMVGSELYAMLAQHSIPILAVGDHAQLPPVGSSLNLMADPMVRLEHIHRQAAESPILRLAESVRNGEALEPWGIDCPEVQFRTKSDWQRVLSLHYPNWMTAPEHLERVVLTLTNRVRNIFNREVRSVLRRGESPENGDLVVCLKNIKPSGVFNGYRGIFEPTYMGDVDTIRGEVEFPAEKQWLFGKFNRYQFGRAKTFGRYDELAEHGMVVTNWVEAGYLFDFAYAMTVHKAQGSEWPLVVLALEGRPGWMSRKDYQRWLYTAVTRASEKLILLG